MTNWRREIATIHLGNLLFCVDVGHALCDDAENLFVVAQRVAERRSGGNESVCACPFWRPEARAISPCLRRRALASLSTPALVNVKLWPASPPSSKTLASTAWMAFSFL